MSPLAKSSLGVDWGKVKFKMSATFCTASLALIPKWSIKKDKPSPPTVPFDGQRQKRCLCLYCGCLGQGLAWRGFGLWYLGRSVAMIALFQAFLTTPSSRHRRFCRLYVSTQLTKRGLATPSLTLAWIKSGSRITRGKSCTALSGVSPCAVKWEMRRF